MTEFALQWFGFISIIVGTWFYGTRPVWGAAGTALGCVGIGTWAYLQHPVPWGVFGVQTFVGLLSIRNIIINQKSSTIDLLPKRRVMVDAVLARHLQSAIMHFPDGHLNMDAVKAENETYRPYAEADVDAIILGLARE